ncbi:Ribosomal RNA small subunit methyltransferase A [Candidatus Izimaplasma bacterium HR1]|jgi:16S rRNA (adenine1518-N6/adenine1519-N6)-dimethyltransferase|uniref:16S rRNA (adenine(1518)-N(6)/adenine(1519)-N(6))- dimethyltransferase RsmA n=1 Tax=Candidatus Izimoplasma sp. HR1 TaxID=1541959 RepID=UPI0004F606F9|nr:Ribosomal RNA small subunit methyltransferase A [Candidatus Izimaplasma bacterium HR1]
MAKIGTIGTTKNTLKKHDFHIKKKFGQNFLTDQNILRRITDIASIDKETLVVEIGPGLGSMTELLLEKAKNVLAYEIDKDLVPILLDNLKDDRLILINDDILKRNIDEDITNLNSTYSNIVLVANLPYYITTPIIMKVLEESTQVKELVIMMQLEVARRFTSVPSTKDYNSLSVVIQFKTESKIALKVPKTVFVPAPNVDSAVIHMKVKEKIEPFPNDLEVFYKLVRTSFTQRRKTLVNNLSSGFSITKDKLSNTLVDLGFSQSVRAEELTVNDFITLSNEFNRDIL